MRLLVCAILALTALPAAAQAPTFAPINSEVVTEKIALKFIDPDQAIKLIMETRAPEGVTGILGYPLDNSLLMRGSVASIAAFKAGIAVLDVKIPDLPRNGVTVTAEVKDPAALKAELEKLPGAGQVTTKEKEWTLVGPREWVRAAIVLLARAAMVDRGARLNAGLGKPSFPTAPTVLSEIRLRGVPDLAIESDKAELDVRNAVTKFTGKTTVLRFNGTEIRITDRVVTLRRGKDAEDTVITIGPAQK